ncbi:MAG: hypothetical protein AAGB28_10095 [Pseudomonadota bacterium]
MRRHPEDRAKRPLGGFCLTETSITGLLICAVGASGLLWLAILTVL